MRIGYGYGRRRAALEACGVERFYMDTAQSGRSERAHLFRDLRSGDTLVLLKISDLGVGKGLRNMRAELADRGVEIEVAAPQAAEPETPAVMGRPPAWKPDAETDERFRAMWHDVSRDGGYILDQACHAQGEDRTDKKARERVRQRLLRRYGSRTSNREG